ncbi:MAG: hypothetical protein RL580_787 [Pseudomonadota bacterium]
MFRDSGKGRRATAEIAEAGSIYTGGRAKQSDGERRGLRARVQSPTDESLDLVSSTETQPWRGNGLDSQAIAPLPSTYSPRRSVNCLTLRQAPRPPPRSRGTASNPSRRGRSCARHSEAQDRAGGERFADEPLRGCHAGFVESLQGPAGVGRASPSGSTSPRRSSQPQRPSCSICSLVMQREETSR